MEKKWTDVISPKKSLFDVRLREVLDYKDLLFLFVKRDFISVYKQTILGPLWFFIQPILTTLMFTVVFGKIAGISTDGIPKILFYLAGLTFWNFFSTNLFTTSNTFIDNQNIFGKVYFPRIITPLSVICSNLLKFGIQFILFLGFYFYYIAEGSAVKPNVIIFLFPYLIFITAVLSLGFGLIITSLTTKYRDLRFLIQFGVQLWMYATPVIYPLSSLGGKNEKLWRLLNPVSSIIETFKYGFLGSGTFDVTHLLYSTVFAFALFFVGVVIFNKTEQNFMDTI